MVKGILGGPAFECSSVPEAFQDSEVTIYNTHSLSSTTVVISVCDTPLVLWLFERIAVICNRCVESR